MIYRTCGAANDDSAKICEVCGSELMDAEEVTAEEVAVEEIAAEEVAEEVVEEAAEEVAEKSEEEVEVVEEAPETDSEEVVAPIVVKKKSIFKKWWLWLIIGGILISLFIGLIVGVVAILSGSSNNNSSGSGSGSGGGGSSSSTTYVSPYVTLVKTTKNSNYGITYGAAFDRFFSNPKWEYFKATSGEHVVQFKGGFYYENKPATATIQFIVDMNEGTIQVYHLSINGEGQNKLMLAALVKKVFESY